MTFVRSILSAEGQASELSLNRNDVGSKDGFIKNDWRKVMKIPAYKKEEENVIGAYRTYPAIQEMFESYGFPLPPEEPKFNRPVTPKENMKRVLDGKTPYWLPFGGMRTSDIQCFMPRQVPDNYACRLVLDGTDRKCEYPSLIQKSSWFDLEWEYMPAACGSTVRPGKPKIEDMSEWEKQVSMPDLDAVDWQGMKRDNEEYLSTDKFNMLNILSGPWERLMSLMEVEGAAMALIDEDQKEGIHRFFDQYCDFFDSFIGRVKENCRIDGVLMHDDWGHQNGPFFSHQTAEEMLFPYLKRIVESCHKRGLYYEQHSCGRNETFLDLYIEAGVNLYCPQDINDFDLMLEKCRGSQLVIGVPEPALPPEASEETVQCAVKEWLEHYKGYAFVSSALFPNPAVGKELYVQSRNLYAGKEL